MSDLRIATRRSPLALAQARRVAAAIRSAHPHLIVTLVEVTTSGDDDRDTSVTALTEVGAFVRTVQRAVLEGRADLAVHSGKDLPVDGPGELTAFYPEREAPWDVLCGSALDGLPEGSRVGTGSPRRAAQLARLRPELRIEGIRGNVDTRLGKVDSGDYRAVVLAEAGLRRLGIENRITHRFSLEEMVPAPAQGALAVEARAGGEAAELLRVIDHPGTRRAVEAERGLLAATRAGCRSALGVYGEVSRSGLRLVGFVADESGPRRATVEDDDGGVVSVLRAELGL